tara:strand:+ start:605 stop:964 length:360 start_codon:yes stop_codon:yes gene_type:complete
MTIPNRFTGIPAVPHEGLTDLQTQIFSSVKENVELLTGTRGEADLASRAVVRGEISVNTMPDQNLRQVTAKGVGVSISSNDVPTFADYNKLRQDVQTLADDLAYTRSVINLLVRQIRGT